MREEVNVLIATRIKGSIDSWKLETKDFWKIYSSLTETLEAYFQSMGFKGDYRLSPLKGELYAINHKELEEVKIEPKKYNLYGD